MTVETDIIEAIAGYHGHTEDEAATLLAGYVEGAMPKPATATEAEAIELCRTTMRMLQRALKDTRPEIAAIAQAMLHQITAPDQSGSNRAQRRAKH